MIEEKIKPVPKQYLALSIGPIVKTLKEARKTRELWAASYLLSTLMRHLMEQLDPPKEEEIIEKGKGDGETKYIIKTYPHILIPSIPKEVQMATLYGAGIYPDRLFMEAGEITEAEVKEKIEAAFKALARDCLDLENVSKAGVEKMVKEATKFWQNYLRVCFVLKEISIENGKLSLELSPYLESAELEDTFLFEKPETHALQDLFKEETIYKVPLSKALKNDNRGTYDVTLSKTAFVPATYEIAAMELHYADSIALQGIIAKMGKDSPSEVFYEKIQEDKNSKLAKALLPRHKYYCIVSADGDSISAAIKERGSREEYIDFSELLAIFGKDAACEINKYGGKPIYIGGDDLLFLAPLQNGADTVFDLITKLDEIFPNDQLKTKDPKKTVSLSYGLNIAYYKYPLFEAISDSFDIMGKAKKHVTQEKKEKNAISFHFTKHSGSFFDATFSKKFLVTINDATKKFNTPEMKFRRGLVSSLIFKIKTLEKLLIGLVDEAEASDLENRFGYFFDKYFEEWKGSKGFKEQKDAAKKLLFGAYQEVGKEKFLDLYFATMRLIDFINEPNQININDTENQFAAIG